MESQISSFAKMFGADSHSINEQIPNIVFPKSIKFSSKLASFDSCSMMQYYEKIDKLGLSSARKVIHCLPSSNSEVGIGTETTGSSQYVRVKFQLEKECEFGDSYLIVGDDPVLGSWNPSDAIPLNWSEGHIWSLLLEFQVENTIQYKFLHKKRTGEILWQPGPDRSFQAWGTQNVITVTEEWDNAEAQKTSEEQEFVEENKEFMELGPAVIDSHKDSKEEHPPTVSSHVGDLSSDGNASTEERNEADLKQNPSLSADKNAQKEVAESGKRNEQRVNTDKSSAVEEEGNLVTDDEGAVLVPGLTLPLSSSEEAFSKQNQKSAHSENSLGADAPRNQIIPDLPF